MIDRNGIYLSRDVWEDALYSRPMLPGRRRNERGSWLYFTPAEASGRAVRLTVPHASPGIWHASTPPTRPPEARRVSSRLAAVTLGCGRRGTRARRCSAGAASRGARPRGSTTQLPRREREVSWRSYRPPLPSQWRRAWRQKACPQTAADSTSPATRGRGRHAARTRRGTCGAPRCPPRGEARSARPLQSRAARTGRGST